MKANKFRFYCEVLWDFDDGDTPPERNVSFELTEGELYKLGIADSDGKVDEDRLGDYLTDTYKFCHNGFSFTFELMK